MSQPDAVALSWLSAGTVAVVGADAVGPSSFVNAVGTRVLLESARRRRRRTLLVADRGKVVDGADVRRLLAAVPRAGREGSARRWPVFEEIRLVDEQVDEVGLFQVCSSGDRQSV